MEMISSRQSLLTVFEPFCLKGEPGHPPVGLGLMLRMHFLQQWFNLADAIPTADKTAPVAIPPPRFPKSDPEVTLKYLGKPRPKELAPFMKNWVWGFEEASLKGEFTTIA
jgi:hypothetical protein